MLGYRLSSMAMLVLPPLLFGAGVQPALSQTSSESGQKQPEPASSPTKRSATVSQPESNTPATRPTRRPARVPTGQARPTRERYREIQQALADAGHYSDAIDGIWGDRSEVALKQYQESEGLEPTGKIDALTLIRLGLGPQYESPENVSAATPSPG